MKTLLGIICLSIFQLDIFSQAITRVDYGLINENGHKTWIIPDKDSSKFEYYYHCSMSQGFQLRSDLADGDYAVYQNDTLRHTAHFINNAGEGRWIYYYPSGAISTIFTYQDGKKNGYYRSYREDGSLKSDGVYKDNYCDEIIFYDEQGNYKSCKYSH